MACLISFFIAVVDYLKTNVKYVGTYGKYGKNGSVTAGHHPLIGKAFEGDPKYIYDDALSVSKNTLEQYGGTGVHAKITGKQISGYKAWRTANPSPAKLSFADMIEIERQAMIQSDIPEDVANGWIIKAVEDLKKQGVTEITHIPWNGLNN